MLSLILHESKILTDIVLKRIEPLIEGLFTEHQFSFKRGKGTKDVF